MNDDLLNTDFDDPSVDEAAFAYSVQERARDEYAELGMVSLLVELKAYPLAPGRVGEMTRARDSRTPTRPQPVLCRPRQTLRARTARKMSASCSSPISAPVFSRAPY